MLYSICTPNVDHYEMAMYAMGRDIAVVCEKADD